MLPQSPPRPGLFPGLNYPLSVTMVSCGAALVAAVGAALALRYVRRTLHAHAERAATEVDDMASLESPKSPGGYAPGLGAWGKYHRNNQVNPGEETSPPERADTEASIFSAARMRSHLALTAVDEDGGLLSNPVLPGGAPRPRKHGFADNHRAESVARSLLSSRGEVRVQWCDTTHEKSPQLTHTVVARRCIKTLTHL